MHPRLGPEGPPVEVGGDGARGDGGDPDGPLARRQLQPQALRHRPQALLAGAGDTRSAGALGHL